MTLENDDVERRLLMNKRIGNIRFMLNQPSRYSARRQWFSLSPAWNHQGKFRGISIGYFGKYSAIFIANK